jgi:16S rRNA (cytosine967-C5)-methyltransferase
VNREPSPKKKPTPRQSRRQSYARKPGAPAPGPLPLPLGDAARDLVYRKLARQVQNFPNLLIDELNDDAPGTRDMNPRDLAFAHAIYDAVIARWLTLRHLIQPLLTQPITELESRLHAVLLAGAAQLLLLDKVPPYAAINHAVEWAKERIRPGAGAMVNAVLRKVARLRIPDDSRPAFTGSRSELPLPDATCIRLTDDLLPADDLERLSVAASLSPDLLVAWGKRHPLHEVRRLALHTLADPPIVLNTAHLREPLTPAHSALVTPHAVPGHHVFTAGRADLLALLRDRADLWVQDPASSAPISLVADLKLDAALIIDVCAGQGTKTRQLAAVFPTASIIATDTDRRRHETLSRTLADHPRVKVVPFGTLRDDYLRRADLVLLDVPCSNTGVLPRRPEAKYRFNAESLDSLLAMQRQIIADAIPLLRDGSDGSGRGRILYATCSLEPAENEDQARWAEHWHQFHIERESRHAPAGGPGDAPTSYTDGSYAALLA